MNIEGLILSENSAIGRLYDKYMKQLLAKAQQLQGLNITGEQLFSFENYPAVWEDVKKIMTSFSDAMSLRIISGVTGAFNVSEEKNNTLIGALSILSKSAVKELRDTAVDNFVKYRKNPPKGLSLSSKVWNYTRQGRKEFELAMSMAISEAGEKGLSAEELGRKVRGMLADPDAMIRRYHVKKVDAEGHKIDRVEWRKKTVDKDGKVHFTETDLGHPGQGVYRSARKNALRLAATEINMAYRYADHERWMAEPFVIGFRIQLSGSHATRMGHKASDPYYDMCDELVGDYPKWFKWSGWHPRCLCTSTAILIDKDEMRKIQSLPEEEYRSYISPNMINDMPEKYTNYIEANSDRIEAAYERGTLPYFISDNYVDSDIRQGFTYSQKASQTPKKRVRTPEEREAIQKAWDNRKATIASAEELIRQSKDYPLNDDLSQATLKLQEAIQHANYSDAQGVSEEVSAIIGYEKAITPDFLRDSVMRKKYGDEAIEQLYSNTKMVKDSYSFGDADYAENMLMQAELEQFGKMTPTWREAAAIYRREYRIKSDAERVAEYSNTLDVLYGFLKEAGISVSVIPESERDIYHIEKLGELYSRKPEVVDVTKLVNYANDTDAGTEMRSIISSIETKLKTDGLEADISGLVNEGQKIREKIEHQRRMSYVTADEIPQETLADLKARLGSDMPRTLEHLQEKIDLYDRKLLSHSLYTKEESERITNLLRDTFNAYDFGLNIDQSALRSVYSTHFYNTFESGTSGGYDGSSKTSGPIEETHLRLETSVNLFGGGGTEPDKQLARYEFEKYGCLVPKDRLSDHQDGCAEWYGAVTVRFRKDKVVCTWTNGDSLDNFNSLNRLQPSLTTDPHICSLSSMRAVSIPRELDKTDISTLAWQTKAQSDYIELQYHGTLDMSCVKSIHYPKKSVCDFTAEQIKKLKDMGIELSYVEDGELRFF